MLGCEGSSTQNALKACVGSTTSLENCFAKLGSSRGGLQHSREKVVDGLNIVLRCDALGASFSWNLVEQLILVSDARERKHSLKTIVVAKRNVSIQPVPDHADSGSILDVEFLLQVLDHEGGRLPNNMCLHTGASFHCADHRAVASPLLGICEVCDSVKVGGNELAPWKLIQAELRILQLGVVDVPVKANNDCTDVLINIHLAAWAHVHGHVLEALATNPWDIDQVELLADSPLANDVYSLASCLEVGLLQVSCGSEGGRENLLWWNIEAKGCKFALVARSALGGVVGDEEAFLASLAQLVQHIANTWNQGITAPNDTITIKDEDVNPIQEGGWL
mmetsp:Transcript_34892/g.81597  ORF Transcript_34892/g.81597 Transcript_34892/m.81597 type:complete len:335 (+) Transcript_34892:48-1052(+)